MSIIITLFVLGSFFIGASFENDSKFRHDGDFEYGQMKKQKIWLVR